MSEVGIETYKSIVYPWECDAMGHFTTRFYAVAFDVASWHLFYAIGYSPKRVTSHQEGWADVSHKIDYRRELPVSELYAVRSHVVKVGRTSLVSMHRLLSIGEGFVAAECEMTSVYFDLKVRKAMPIPGSLRDGAAALTLNSG
jgi:acyl-CoA thioester hydrolase